MSGSPVPSIPFVCCGHPDTGKSSLAGHLLQLGGQVDDHTFEKLRTKAEANKMKGCEYAYLLDSLEEEQTGGRTVLFNLVNFTYQQQAYTLIDCPGHQIYVRNLLEGLHATNPVETIGCLVVSMAPGEFEAGVKGGQTLEDLLLLRAVGIQQLVVLLNKVDLVSEERQKEVRAFMTQHVRRMGFPTVRYCVISGYHGTGLPEFLAELKDLATQRKPATILPPPTAREHLAVRVKFLFDQGLNILITPGLDLVLHYGAQEYQVEIVKGSMRNAEGVKIAFPRNDSVVTCLLSTLKGTPFMAATGGRVILRREQYTLAFGQVLGEVK